MPFDWREYLEVARFLESQGRSDRFSQEAASRCAVSRAYYAAFCYARNYARDEQRFKPMGRDDDHKALRDHFQQWARRDISSGLDRLRQWRNTCDYADDATPKVSVMLGQAIKEAQKIVDNLTRSPTP